MEPVTFPIAENCAYIWFCVIMVGSATLVEIVTVLLMVKGQVKGRMLKRGEKITYGILMGLLTVVFYLGAVEVYLEAHGSVTVAEDRIHVENGMMYSRDIMFDEIDANETRIVNIHRMKELFPGHRVNGTGLSDLWSGNFRTRNGTKAYLLVSDAENSVMLEARDGTIIYLSPNDPEVFRNLVIERANQ